jgi:hypothetical protein
MQRRELVLGRRATVVRRGRHEAVHAARQYGRARRGAEGGSPPGCVKRREWLHVQAEDAQEWEIRGELIAVSQA